MCHMESSVQVKNWLMQRRTCADTFWLTGYDHSGLKSGLQHWYKYINWSFADTDYNLLLHKTIFDNFLYLSFLMHKAKARLRNYKACKSKRNLFLEYYDTYPNNLWNDRKQTYILKNLRKINNWLYSICGMRYLNSKRIKNLSHIRVIIN